VQELPEFLPHMTLNAKPLKNLALSQTLSFANTGVGRTIVELKSGQTLFCQGEPAGAVYYLERGKVKIAGLSKRGKEATIALLSSGSFLGRECIAGPELHRKTTAMALTPVSVLKIKRGEMIRGLREEQPFCEMFIRFRDCPQMRAYKTTLLISFSTPVRNNWPVHFCCWPSPAKIAHRKQSSPK
jgi:CRP-like cAMP-binding protein